MMLLEAFPKMEIFALDEEHWDLRGVEDGRVKLLTMLMGDLLRDAARAVDQRLKSLSQVDFSA